MEKNIYLVSDIQELGREEATISNLFIKKTLILQSLSNIICEVV